MDSLTKMVFGQLLSEERARLAASEGKAVAREATYFDLVWAMREREMDHRQRTRDRGFDRFRPVLTLGGDGIEFLADTSDLYRILHEESGYGDA